MSDDSSKGCHAPSKACITIDVQSDNHTIRNNIDDICDKAQVLLASDAPTEKTTKCLLDSDASPLQLQNTVTKTITQLVPSNCWAYLLMHLQSVDAPSKNM